MYLTLFSDFFEPAHTLRSFQIKESGRQVSLGGNLVVVVRFQ